jgi:ASC-1-like (ASCH) protein
VSVSKKRFLFPVKALSRVFRGKFMDDLKTGFRQGLLSSAGEKELVRNLWSKNWVVYAKPPFRKPEDVLEYLGRYTHRVALSNNRIISLKDGKVTIELRNRKTGTRETVHLDAVEFIRRFMQHILPSGFMKIRHYGFLANRYKKEKVADLRQKLGLTPGLPKKPQKTIPEMMMDLTGKDITLCPVCSKETLVPMAELPNIRKIQKAQTTFAFG